MPPRPSVSFCWMRLPRRPPHPYQRPPTPGTTRRHTEQGFCPASDLRPVSPRYAARANPQGRPPRASRRHCPSSPLVCSRGTFCTRGNDIWNTQPSSHHRRHRHQPRPPGRDSAWCPPCPEVSRSQCLVAHLIPPRRHPYSRRLPPPARRPPSGALPARVKRPGTREGCSPDRHGTR